MAEIKHQIDRRSIVISMIQIECLNKLLICAKFQCNLLHQVWIPPVSGGDMNPTDHKNSTDSTSKLFNISQQVHNFNPKGFNSDFASSWVTWETKQQSFLNKVFVRTEPTICLLPSTGYLPTLSLVESCSHLFNVLQSCIQLWYYINLYSYMIYPNIQFLTRHQNHRYHLSTKH